MKKSNLWWCVMLAIVLAGCPTDNAEGEGTEQGADAVEKTIEVTGLLESDFNKTAQIDVFSVGLSNRVYAATGSAVITDKTLLVELYDWPSEGGQSESRWMGSGEWYVCLRLFDAEGGDYAAYLWKDGQKCAIQEAVTTLDFGDFELVVGDDSSLTVLFHADGGRPATQTRTVPSSGDSVDSLPDEPTRAGYTFDGWYTLTGGEFTESTIVTADLTVVYAKWSQTGGGSDFITSVAELIAFLDDTPGGESADDPILVRMKVDLADEIDGWEAILQAIKDKGKYVDLDVTECQWGPEFDPKAYQTGEPYITGLVLPNAAESIKAGDSWQSPTFRYFTSLKTLSAAKVETVGQEAFYKCMSLSSVSLPEATDIGKAAFYFCKSLAEVSLPKAASIGERAFAESGLKTVNLPVATSIGNKAFWLCTSLSSVSLPAAMSIDEAFRDCTNLVAVYLPAATSIGYWAFMDCPSLAAVSLPKATSIGEQAFCYCTSLTTVYLPAAASIGELAFRDCTSLAAVSLPAATSIDEYAFYGCTSLTTVSLPAALPITVGGDLFTNTSQGTSAGITLIVPSAEAVTAYTNSSKWGVSTAGGKTSVYGDKHNAVTIEAAP